MGINEDIHINQVGYRPGDPKVVVTHGISGIFQIVEKQTGDVIFEGPLVHEGNDSSSGDSVYMGDFSVVEKEGSYYIKCDKEAKSYSFRIHSDIYKEVKNALLKAFYFQRCGVKLEETYAGLWKHDACHTSPGHVHGNEEKVFDCTGGWHDAGDYGKYTVPAAKAVADLLLAYEFFPQAFKEDINIPESGNGIPDILDECRYELEWLFKMQKTEDGGVYHKVTTGSFPGLTVMPEDDKDKLYFSPVSAAATGDFAAVMAMAARVYSGFNKQFAAKCLNAAEIAWGWLNKNTGVPGFKNPIEIHTGEYGDRNDRDERFWAAAELFRTTFREEYHRYIIQAVEDKDFDLYDLGWADVGGYGTIAYLFSDTRKVDLNLYERLRKGFLETADKYFGEANDSGYGISLEEEDYIWGSNMLVLNNAMHLIIAHRICGRKEYAESAMDHFHYILGRNPLNQCYVSGFGSRPLRNPHHRPSVADDIEEAVPGLVSGGPNMNLQDDCAKEHLKDLPPARCFIDDKDSYSTNEIAIYWNSPAVFAAAFCDSFSFNE